MESPTYMLRLKFHLLPGIKLQLKHFSLAESERPSSSVVMTMGLFSENQYSTSIAPGLYQLI